MSSEHTVAAPIDKTEHVILCDFLAKTNAARAKNAALIVQRNARTELNILGFFDFVFEETRIGLAVLDAEFLEKAFAGLIANWAIERMIDEKKFHHTTPAFLDQRRHRPHAHPFGDILCAGNLRARHPVDNRFAIGAEIRLAIGAHFREAHFDQAHSAIAGRRKFLVIAIARHIATGLLASFDQARAFWKLPPNAIDLDVEHWD